jgi:hypothetical protein
MSLPVVRDQTRVRGWGLARKLDRAGRWIMVDSLKTIVVGACAIGQLLRWGGRSK